MDKWLSNKSGKKTYENLDVQKSIAVATSSENEYTCTTTSGKEDGNQRMRTSSSDVNVVPSPKKKIKLDKKIRNYQIEYVKYGFTCTIINKEPRPLCILCHEILANDSMKPARLERHLKSKHPEQSEKPIEYFQRKLKSCNRQSTTLQNFTKLNDKYLQASFEVSYLIAKDKKPHTIGESLLLPAAVRMVDIIHGKEYTEKLKAIPLSDNSVARRIEMIAEDIKKQLLEQLTLCGKFALQLDESTDVANMAQLLVFIRYFLNEELHEELLFCHPLKEKCTGEEIFSEVNDFFHKNKLSWDNCISFTTDGAAALMGSKKGLKGRVMEIAPHVKFIHCIIHRQAIATKKLEPQIHQVLQDVISVVNFIKSKPLKNRIFGILCNEMGSNYETLLYHTEVRWLSRGKVLRRVIELKDELTFFFLEKEKSSKFADLFRNENWLMLVCYLADIFEKVNCLNLSLQGHRDVLTMSEKITAFRKKLLLWRENFENGSLEMFPTLSEFIAENEIDLSSQHDLILVHLKNLEEEFSVRFKNISDEEFKWVLNPFNKCMNFKHLPIAFQEQLIDIQEDTNLKATFHEKALHSWWIGLKNEYPDLVIAATNALLPFGSTYLCEQTFSAMVDLKTRKRNKLNLEPDLRIAVSQALQPRFSELVNKCQAQPSH